MIYEILYRKIHTQAQWQIGRGGQYQQKIENKRLTIGCRDIGLWYTAGPIEHTGWHHCAQGLVEDPRFLPPALQANDRGS